MYPSAGLGAVSAIHDAVALANCIYELPVNPTLDDIKDAFKLYKSERYPLAKTAYDTSHRLTTIIQQVKARQSFLEPVHLNSHI